jgi:hypothetical protein
MMNCYLVIVYGYCRLTVGTWHIGWEPQHLTSVHSSRFIGRHLSLLICRILYLTQQLNRDDCRHIVWAYFLESNVRHEAS